jgi:predicted alpha/beta hydrolase family esterase
VLVAHSGGCWAAASWVANRGSDALGLFLVAPPDQHGDFFRAALPSFTAVVPQPLELPGLVVSSDNDPWCAPQVAEQLAADWGVPRIGVGQLGQLLEWNRQVGFRSCTSHRLHRRTQGSNRMIIVPTPINT